MTLIYLFDYIMMTFQFILKVFRIQAMCWRKALPYRAYIYGFFKHIYTIRKLLYKMKLCVVNEVSTFVLILCMIFRLRMRDINNSYTILSKRIAWSLKYLFRYSLCNDYYYLILSWSMNIEIPTSSTSLFVNYYAYYVIFCWYCCITVVKIMLVIVSCNLIIFIIINLVIEKKDQYSAYIVVSWASYFTNNY